MSQAPAGSTPDPDMPHGDVPTGAEAASALAAAAAAEDAQKQAIRASAWVYVSTGLCLGVVVAANAVATSWVRAFLLVGALATMGFTFGLQAWTWRRKGIRLPGPPRYSTASIVVLMVVLGVVATGGFLLGHRHPDQAPLLGTFTFVAFTAVCLIADAWFSRRGGAASR